MAFLRPVYTEYLFKQLQKQSLNVYGATGQGRERLLDDLQQLAQAENYLVLRANMHVYAHNHQGFVADLAKQLATALGIEAGKSKLETLLENHAQGKAVCIFLHHFDVLLNNTQIAGQYDISFFNQLNAWRNRVNCKLLCMTELPYTKYRFYNKEIHNTSPLDLKGEELANLSYEEELQRRALGFSDSLLLPVV